VTLTVNFPVSYVDSLSEAETEEDVVRICAAWLPQVMSVDRVAVTVVEGNDVVVRAVSEDGAVLPGTEIDLRFSLTWRAWQTGRTLTLHAPDAMGSDAIAALFRQGYRTVVITPMIANGVLMGSLNLSSRRADAFDAEDLLRAEALGRWIGSQLLIRKYGREMERLAMQDPMTGIPNRRAFLTEAEARMSVFLRNGTGFSLVIFDIDHFKRVNDRFGHEAGDIVLQRTAALVREELPPELLLARIGGEEFAFLLSDSAVEAAIAMAERCRMAIAATVFRSGRRSLFVSASFGCAVTQIGDMAVSDVLRRADKALYAAKAAGRNRVCRAA
jgi:diguanylate cyclase (GGDEF)-like protein